MYKLIYKKTNDCFVAFTTQIDAKLIFTSKQSSALYSSHYEHFIIIDFNVEANDSVISNFSNTYDLKALLKSQHVIRTPTNLLALTLF